MTVPVTKNRQPQQRCIQFFALYDPTKRRKLYVRFMSPVLPLSPMRIAPWLLFLRPGDSFGRVQIRFSRRRLRWTSNKLQD